MATRTKSTKAPHAARVSKLDSQGKFTLTASKVRVVEVCGRCPAVRVWLAVPGSGDGSAFQIPHNGIDTVRRKHREYDEPKDCVQDLSRKDAHLGSSNRRLCRYIGEDADTLRDALSLDDLDITWHAVVRGRSTETLDDTDTHAYGIGQDKELQLRSDCQIFARVEAENTHNR